MRLLTGRGSPSRHVMARLVAVVLGLALVVGTACSDSDADTASTLTNPNETGTELVNRYVTLAQDKDEAGLRNFISDAFIIQRADGSYSEKDAYLEDLPEIGTFEITEVTALQANNSLVVRWILSVDQVINGTPFSGDPAPRLSTFVYQDGEWRLSSHANFNVPEDAVSTQ